MIRQLKLKPLALLLAMLLALTFGNASAESVCKGMSQSSCSSKDVCTWVNGYTRKDGVKVKGYCRSKGKSGSSKGSSSSSKKSDKKSSDKSSGTKDKSSKKSDKKSSSSKDKKSDSKKSTSKSKDSSKSK